MRWCFESATHPYADSILDRLAAGDTAVVPVLWFYEVSAVLSRAQNSGTLAASKAAEFITQLQSLDIAADDAGVAHVLTEVHRLALTYRLTSYDAAYLELAIRLNLALATLDDELMRAGRAAGVALV
jgi:predicted nucleic acid-binding protein